MPLNAAAFQACNAFPGKRNLQRTRSAFFNSRVSAFNTVTFESKSGTNTDAVISYTAADATVAMNGVSYVSFENLTIDHKTPLTAIAYA